MHRRTRVVRLRIVRSAVLREKLPGSLNRLRLPRLQFPIGARTVFSVRVAQPLRQLRPVLSSAEGTPVIVEMQQIPQLKGFIRVRHSEAQRFRTADGAVEVGGSERIPVKDAPALIVSFRPCRLPKPLRFGHQAFRAAPDPFDFQNASRHTKPLKVQRLGFRSLAHNQKPFAYIPAI